MTPQRIVDERHVSQRERISGLAKLNGLSHVAERIHRNKPTMPAPRGEQGENTKTRIHGITEIPETDSCRFKPSHGISMSPFPPTKQMGKYICGHTIIWVIGVVG